MKNIEVSCAYAGLTNDDRFDSNAGYFHRIYRSSLGVFSMYSKDKSPFDQVATIFYAGDMLLATIHSASNDVRWEIIGEN